MLRFKTKILSIVLLTAAIVIIASSCSRASNAPPSSESSTNIESETTGNTNSADAEATDEPAIVLTPAPTESTAVSTIDPVPTADATAQPSVAPAQEKDTDEQQEAEKKPTKKPAAAATAMPRPTLIPTASPTVKPTQKPAATAVTVKPTASPFVKPSTTATTAASAIPSPLPIATASPTPKPTTKPNQGNPNGEVTVADIAAKLSADAGLGPLAAVEGDKIMETYSINSDKQLIDGSFYQATLMMQAGEFSVVQLKSDADFDSVKTGFEKRAAALQSIFKDYLQDQYEQAKNYQIIRNGNFVLFSITPDQQKTAELFHGFFKNNDSNSK
ncbi:DUF4358 domain-containing protein [Paenibacillus sinopodophylli]|uniref:DUF4358 domain-containing protein n=1 Tax=Paenibacillus sinopodophylli TaxID=1837342 RepID=UPI00110CDFAD|nr:DUF4358 domain-containing protein [Paenibacillus sinopodophylli]